MTQRRSFGPQWRHCQVQKSQKRPNLNGSRKECKDKAKVAGLVNLHTTPNNSVLHCWAPQWGNSSPKAFFFKSHYYLPAPCWWKVFWARKIGPKNFSYSLKTQQLAVTECTYVGSVQDRCDITGLAPSCWFWNVCFFLSDVRKTFKLKKMC